MAASGKKCRTVPAIISLAGVNPVHHPEIFGDPALARELWLRPIARGHLASGQQVLRAAETSRSVDRPAHGKRSGVALIASGIMRVVLAFRMKEGMPWIGVCLSGVITLLLGLVILAHWPVSSIYILGLFLGIDLVFAGAGWIAVGIGLKPHA
jgi:hypothetical protein